MTRSDTAWPPTQAEPPAYHPKAPTPGTELSSHYAECFGCGEDQPSGLHMHTEAGDDHVFHSKFTVTRDHQGAPGLAHGGLLSCAFDEALGIAVGHLLRKPAVTGRLETDFRKPVPVGSTLYIAAKVDGVDGRKIYASATGRLGAADGPLAVRARAVFIMVAVEHFTEHGDAGAIEKLRAAAEAKRKRWEINP